MAHANLEDVKRYLLDLQDRLCQALAEEDASADFHEDAWERPEGGGGRSRWLLGDSHVTRSVCRHDIV